MAIPGFVGRILRVDLTEGKTSVEELDEATLKKWVGGAGLGAKYLYDEVPPGVKWSDPENRLIWTTGPLAGSGVSGAGTFNVTTKGALTELAAMSQANGFFGAYMKFSGFDGIVFQGKSPRLVYLWIHDGQAEIRDARHLAGKDAWEVEDALRQELGMKERDVSVYCIGPAGENGVLHATIVGDRGHVVAHGGIGTVMGSKNLKAVVAHRGSGKTNFEIFDPKALKEVNDRMFEFAKTFGPFYQWGTGGGFSAIYGQGALPVKNYTTNIFPEHEQMNGQYMRTHYKVKAMPCYRCRVAHVKEVEVTEGPYKGFVGEEPEYEQLAAWGPQIGNTELGATVMLTKEVDRLGLDCNEASWSIGWAMECYEKGVFTKKETDGLDLSWGNVEAVKELLGRIARREGYLGNLLADGVRRASQKIGGEAADWAIYAGKGATPRSHDHRGRWSEMFDTSLSNTSTMEATWGVYHTAVVDMPPVKDAYSHDELANTHYQFQGIRMIDDCLGICRIATPHSKMLVEALNAATGWNWSLQDAFTAGRRIVNLLRVFNFRHGMDVSDEKPSKRYGSVPVDGPNQGKDIMAKWPEMVRTYYKGMGWDENTGKPLPETLKALGLEEIIKDL
ncbi:MAG: aldehyde ferredoxin oxidoreductase family protein [Chloroflexota bacterium]